MLTLPVAIPGFALSHTNTTLTPHQAHIIPHLMWDDVGLMWVYCGFDGCKVGLA